MEDEIYISLGGNVGEREKFLCSAIEKIADKMNVLAASSLYETEPWGLTGQPNFLNAVLRVSFGGKPEEILKIFQEIEDELGRERKVVWGKRTIDIDILLFGNLIISTPALTIPHRYLLMRDFFMVPLVEIAPDVKHPLFDGKISDFEKKLPPQLRTIINIKEDETWRSITTSLLKDQ